MKSENVLSWVDEPSLKFELNEIFKTDDEKSYIEAIVLQTESPVFF